MKKFHKQLDDIFVAFNTEEKLQEMFHPCDTQTNEGLNTCVLHGAPKHKNHSTTMSLAARVSCRAGVNSVGHVKHFTAAHEALGVAPGRNTLRAWCAIDKEMACHQKCAKKHSTKSRRVQKQNDEMKKGFKEDIADKK